jgi:hypothetical protein
MKRDKITEALSGLDEKYIDEALNFNQEKTDAKTGDNTGKHRNKAVIYRWIAIAAGFVLVLTAVSTVIAIKAEEAEYNKALAFFEQNYLSVEGLDRADIKKAYKEIISGRYEGEDVSEVIKKVIPGYEIADSAINDPLVTGEPDSLNEQATWIRVNKALGRDRGYNFTIKWKRKEVPDKDGNMTIGPLEKSIVTCTKDDVAIWTAEIEKMHVDTLYIKRTSVGTLIWGLYQDRPVQYGKLICVDDNGKIIWEKCYENSSDPETVRAVLESKNGTIAVFSLRTVTEDTGKEYSKRIDNKIGISIIDKDGRELSYKSFEEKGSFGIDNAVLCKDGFLLACTRKSTPVIYMLASDGSVEREMSLDSEDFDYKITDMIEYGENFILSAYAYPHTESNDYSRDVLKLLTYCVSHKQEMKNDTENASELVKACYGLYSDELLELAKENFTAVMFLCNKDTGEFEAFYSVKDSWSGEFSLSEDGKLQWFTISVSDIAYVPQYNSCSLIVFGNVLCNVIDEEGCLTNRRNTGKGDQLRR